jgi:hypothetical protein
VERRGDMVVVSFDHNHVHKVPGGRRSAQGTGLRQMAVGTGQAWWLLQPPAGENRPSLW